MCFLKYTILRGDMENIVFSPIGVVHSPLKEGEGAPIQPVREIKGIVEIFSEFEEGIDGLEGFSHIIVLYHFHLAKRGKLKVIPYMDNKPHGVFATRAPSRPNPIGLSVLKLERIEGSKLYVSGLDILDGTPVIDIKPYVPQFDVREVEKIGWLEEKVKKLTTTTDDGRFLK